MLPRADEQELRKSQEPSYGRLLLPVNDEAVEGAACTMSVSGLVCNVSKPVASKPLGTLHGEAWS